MNGRPDVHQLLGKGRELQRSGDVDTARRCFEQALHIQPDHPDALHLMGVSLLRSGRAADAVPYLQRAVESQSRSEHRLTLARALREAGWLDEASHQLDLLQAAAGVGVPVLVERARLHRSRGDAAASLDAYAQALRLEQASTLLAEAAGAALQLGGFTQAVQWFTRLVQDQPHDATASNALGVAWHMQGRLDEAQAAYARALELDPDLADAWANTGTVAYLQNRLEEAGQAHRRALQLRPEHRNALCGLASVMELQGEYQAAKELLEPHLEPPDPELAAVYARLSRRLKDTDTAYRVVDRALSAPGLWPPSRRQLLYERAALEDAQGDARAALVTLAEAAQQASILWDPAAFRAQVDSIISTWTRAYLTGLHAGADDLRPVFILGMPRSGTTLIEQILASHGQVFGAGETDGTRAAQAVYASSGDPVAAAQSYLAVWPRAAEGATRVVDKLPQNFLHLGLIQAMFPGARIIHCIRDPFDVVMSCYFQNFIAAGMGFSQRLDWLEDYYRQYRRLMAHWRQTLSLPVLDVPYAELVTEPEAWARRLVAFAGLDWDPACREPHLAARNTNTASHAQVREPINTRGLDRYCAYRALLPELAERLAAI